MDLVFIFDMEVLLSLSTERSPSPEAFIEFLEDAIESREMTIDEVKQYIADYYAKQR